MKKIALVIMFFFFFQAEDGIRDRSPSRGLGDVYKRQILIQSKILRIQPMLFHLYLKIFQKVNIKSLVFMQKKPEV